jgi:hypothetical protein
VDDLDFGIKDVTFEAKVFNKYGTFDWIINRSMEDLGYAYLHCDLLNFHHNHLEGEIVSYKGAWTTFAERYVCDGGKFWQWIKVQKGLWEKGYACCHYNWVNNHCVINSYIPTKLVPMFFPHRFD